MSQKSQYEELLATYSQSSEAIALLKRHRPYLELLPSVRRPEESVITIPLPIVKIRYSTASPNGQTSMTSVESLILPCEVVMLMCDPEWKIKTGKEILVLIHRPEEDFSDLLGRWRHIQVLLGKDYEWVFPPRYQHILNEGAEKIYPLFVVFDETPERVKRGLKGAHLPFITEMMVADTVIPSETSEAPASESAKTED